MTVVSKYKETDNCRESGLAIWCAHVRALSTRVLLACSVPGAVYMHPARPHSKPPEARVIAAEETGSQCPVKATPHHTGSSVMAETGFEPGS